MVQPTKKEAKGMKQVLVDILRIKGKTLADLKRSGAMKVKNGGYMDLNVDYLGKECGLDKYAVAHNYIQEGDVMKDPDMMFYDLEFENDFWASSFEQDNPPISQFSMVCENGQLQKNDKLQKQHQSFSKQWARNLKQQGFTEVSPKDITLEE